MNENQPSMQPLDQGRMLRMAVFVEGGMGLLAIVLGMLFGLNPLSMIHVEPDRWPDLLGMVAIVPMFGAFFLVARLPLASFKELRQKLDLVILPLFRGLPLSDLFWLSLLAGVGEELLFRGFFHLWMLDWFGLPAALAITAVAFGLVHWITPTYALLAGAMGLLLSASMVWSENLLVAILVHGLYDFFALWYYLRVVLHSAGPVPVSEDGS
ncbi:MAG: CPBP family intramembrane metalloprotease [Leptospiraceae bacterium]|nr:CPBP family intramembrane metalloprotease [Leptospiraceae bacterium]